MRNKAENHQLEGIQLECETISKDEIEREKKESKVLEFRRWKCVRVTVALQLKGVE